MWSPGDEFVLTMRLLDHVFDNMVVDELKVSIVLPEGASDLQLDTPFPVTREEVIRRNCHIRSSYLLHAQ